MAEQEIGRYYEKGKQLERILSKLLEDGEFLKLMSPSLIPSNNPQDELMYTQLDTQFYYPPVDSEGIFVFVTPANIRGDTFFKNTDIKFSILIHRNLWTIKKELRKPSGLRAYEIADRIELLINRENTTKSLSHDFFTSSRQIEIGGGVYQLLELVYSNWN